MEKEISAETVDSQEQKKHRSHAGTNDSGNSGHRVVARVDDSGWFCRGSRLRMG